MYKLQLSITSVCLTLIVFSCQQPQNSPEVKYRAYCGSCHLAPRPEDMTKDLWKNKILPEMGARLGIKVDGYDPYAGKNMDERMMLETYGVYPEQALIPESDWAAISAYVLQLAPDQMPVDTLRELGSEPLVLFNADTFSIDNQAGSLITNINYQAAEAHFVTTDAIGSIWDWSPDSAEILYQDAQKSIVDYALQGGKEFITEIGQMHPTDMSLGQLWVRENGRTNRLATSLKRPVYTTIADLNEDGVEEIIICEFGNFDGQLSLLSKTDGRYRKTTLLDQAGGIKVEVKDLNGDGKKDIIALFAQGNEGMYIFLQEDDLVFKMKQVIQLSPLYGSSSFDLVDFDGDGDMDLVIACGDNADYTPVFKPYHGIRLYINDGDLNFEESFFFPMYGATQVLAEDFDQDGDMDIAASAFFPDFIHSPQQSFVFLENTNTSGFEFKPYVTQLATEGRWIVMEKGDADKDGDTDILLGSFTYSPAQAPPAYIAKWNESTVDLLLLTNKLK